ncbi:pur operon repressor [Companilactobacillus sp. RD055328]|uniref:pur operon repressor n=1 Tax=Companilactobacillus sp. RD055328 TaxID=2916634 RepID=UPI001FC8BE90|nr:pur operon repressor [Companilactobacillus sp. RD055328]GKQ42313.1 pur operon repressor [Companilactobacillus sp. RD055328]
MKIRRSERLIDATNYLLNNPHTLIPLTYFAKRYDSAKSSISEDLGIVKKTFLKRGIGFLETLPGAGGGVIYTPAVSKEVASDFIEEMVEKLTDAKRLLPGGYVYLSDLLGSPDVLRRLGAIIATQYADSKVDAVMTVATKGIPIAQSVASYLNVPFVIVRRDSKITEGSTVSVNYVSGSSSRIEKMELSKRSLPENSRVLVVDDFMKGGGTVSGMEGMIKEFNSELVGVTVFAESPQEVKNLDFETTSLIKVKKIDTDKQKLQVEAGSFLKDIRPDNFS